MGEEEKAIDAAAGALKRYLFRGLMILLVISLSINGITVFMLRSAIKNAERYEAEKIQLSEKMKTIQEKEIIIYKDRERIVGAIYTNEVMATRARSNREKIQGDYADAHSWADAVRVWSNHNP